MSSWVAVAFGALDIRTHEFGADRYEYVVTPISHGEPLMLHGVGAEVWRRLVGGPVPDSDLDNEERRVVEDMYSLGIASADSAHTARVRSVSEPWLMSPVHELVYALLERVAVQSRIRIVFIKGPTLHAQGLRERSHSGDVDCWVEPGSELRFARAMQEWGWTPAVSAFTGTRVLHSLTLRANDWGCAIDVHSWFPGMSASPQDSFDAVYQAAERRQFASFDGLTPSREFHAVVGALNEVRPILGHNPEQRHVDAAANILSHGGTSTLSTAKLVGAEYALARAFEAAFPEHSLDLLDAPVPPDWAWRQQRSILRAYLAALKIVPLRDRPRIVFRALWPTAESLRAGPFSDGGSVAHVGTLRVRRMIQGLREVRQGSRR